jgi:pyrimidine-nucleoside phosphorylase
LSGRGLGHTGGTIDKLESIPGFRTELPRNEQMEIVSRVGCMNVATTANLVPADRRMYSLRNDTDTVKEAGLIAASVMSKKIASGADYLVLDVKCGNGAFFDDEAKAIKLARLAQSIGQTAGRIVGCVISDMNQPLGFAVGNALELREILALMEGSSEPSDVLELCLTLGALLLVQTGEQPNEEQARRYLIELLQSGAVFEKFKEWVSAQGGDAHALNVKLAELADYRHIYVTALSDGWIAGFNTTALGEFARELGAGRKIITDEIDPLVGFVLEKKIGDEVSAGEVIAEVVASPRDNRRSTDLAEEFSRHVQLSSSPVERPQLIKNVLQ